MTLWQRWWRQPQSVLLRRVAFQIHLWTGISVGLYVLMISLTGTVLVYRNELYRAYSPRPVIVAASGAPKTSDELKDAARRAYPGSKIVEFREGKTVNQAVEITLARDRTSIRRLFHPYTAEDLGNPLPLGFRMTAWMLDLHDNLLSGDTGRRINGVGALLLLLLSATGAFIWWPGIASWRGSVVLDVHSNWKRLNWSLHSMLGFWCFAFVLLWGITGLYLSFPDSFAAVFDFIEPLDEANPVERVGDRIQYWLAYLHFGRLGGRGIPGCGRGFCDSATKAIWAVVSLAPPLLFMSGAVMWWNRVLGPWLRSAQTKKAGAPQRPGQSSSVVTEG